MATLTAFPLPSTDDRILRHLDACISLIKQTKTSSSRRRPLLLRSIRRRPTNIFGFVSEVNPARRFSSQGTAQIAVEICSKAFAPRFAHETRRIPLRARFQAPCVSQDSKKRLFGTFSVHISTREVSSFRRLYPSKVTDVFFDGQTET